MKRGVQGGGGGGRKRRRRSIHRSASSPGVGRLPLRGPSLAPPIIIIFYHNICFSHILFYVNGRSLLLPAPPVPLSLFLSLFFSLFLYLPPPSRPPRSPPISSRRPSLRMHGLRELLAFCLEFKKFFHLSLLPRPAALRPDLPPSPSPRLVAQPSLSSLRISSVSFRARLHAPYARFCLVNIRGEKYKETWNGRKSPPLLLFLFLSFVSHMNSWRKKIRR